MVKKMTSEFTRTAVPQLVSHELEFSKSQHEEKFHSLHEAESVIREELEEQVEVCRKLFEDLHSDTRQDDKAGAVINAKYLEGSAVYAAYEAIQLAAMCLKLVEMAGREDEA